jgi:hypothetical protein
VTYSLNETSGHLLILRRDGVLVYKLKLDDRAFAEQILARLNHQA